MPEYFCSPIWIAKDGVSFENINIDDINLITDNLKEIILKWDMTYQNTFNQEYPPDSMFKNSEEELEFERKGIQILKQLHYEIEKIYKISYFSVKKNKLISFEDILGDNLY